ncbi:MAG: POT family MFS transporter [Fuerstiella sp.]|nr:POT family MFS transporter [Fuerstiella sp.]
MAKQQYRSVPDETSGLPKGIKYIIGNEAAERFSFYGMRTILVVFMTKYLHYMVDGEVGTEMSDAKANEYYHNFVAATYFFPVMGSFLSDILIGKYRTILWLSIVYCLGHLSLALMGGAGLAPGSWLMAGLFLIALGSGGIKPCVSAHVGDQFGTKNSHLMTKVFQWFYFAINFGSTASTWMTPLLLKWYGPHIAFGVPGVLMAIATLMFWMGRNVFIHVPPGGSRFFRETFSRDGVVALLKLSTIYAFVAVFWGLFDQTGSSWVIQAENMDRRFLGITWLQSQIQVLNPILVMILIPLFQLVIYPFVDTFVFRLTAIRKISIGFFLTAASFAVVAKAQDLIDGGATPSIAWQLWAYVLLTSGEVLISITGLEFSYTQAPKTMKSVIMAVWLFSVSLGNIFTSVVNHSIQVPGISQVAADAKSQSPDTKNTIGTWTFRTSGRSLEGSEESGKTITISGVDGNFDTADDIVMHFNQYNILEDVETSDNESIAKASEIIEQAFFSDPRDDSEKALPTESKGQELLAGLTDSYGNAFVYSQQSKNDYRIASSGPDGINQTQWDIILSATVSRVASDEGSSAGDEPYDWLEQRIIAARGDEGKASVEAARGNIAETAINHSITVGGQDTMEGGDYFWFWTFTILVTSVLFVPVGYFYKEKSYIQSQGSDESLVESEDVDGQVDGVDLQ